MSEPIADYVHTVSRPKQMHGGGMANVRGIGERSSSAFHGHVVTEVVELAMRDAAQRLQTSFFDVPEARRWARGLPAIEVNAPSDGDRKRDILDFPYVKSRLATVSVGDCVTKKANDRNSLQLKNQNVPLYDLRPTDLRFRLSSDRMQRN